jgi:membrane-associated progesterone receptor component
MSDAADQPKKERFAPKELVTLQPPKDDIINRDHLAKCDGMPDSSNSLQNRVVDPP